MALLNIFTANKRIAELEAQNEDLISKWKQFETDKADYIKQIESHAETIMQLQEQVKDLQAQVSVANKQAESKAASIVASIGVPAETIKETVEPTITPDSIFSEFVSMKDGPAKTAFYNKHKAVILRFTGLSK